MCTATIFHRSLPALLLGAAMTLGLQPAASAQCQVQKLTASDIDEADQFGDAVALSGDLAVIGASRDDDLGSASGTAYVYRYRLDEDTGAWRWFEEAKLLASDGMPNDLFGWSVAIDAQAPDGAVIVVGAYYDDEGANSNSGSAYVFRHNGSAWVEEAKLTADDAAGGDEFGHAVAVCADWIVVGAARDDDGDTNTGSAYVFHYNGSTWVQAAKLNAPDAAAQDQFAVSLAISGDAIIAGAAMNDHAGSNSGSAYAFRYDGADWLFEQKLTADDAAEGDKFGQSVSISGSLALIGAYLDDEYADNTGSAYVFHYDGAWLQEARLIASDAAADDQFGHDVAILEDPINGDLAVIGAALADDFGSGSGAAYFFSFDGADWLEQAKLTAVDAAALDNFGISVALDSDFLLIGANKDDEGELTNAGSTYVFITATGSQEDCNENGVPDVCDIADGTSADCNGNAIPDECDIADGTSEDVNENGIPDECEDCNNNGVPDYLDIDEGTSQDCNENGIPDECDIADGTSEDVNENGIPDECETDCNNNGVPDFLDIAEGTSADCNENQIPDECDIDDGTSEDCNENGIPDECDVADGTSVDCDENGIPDECEPDCNDNGVVDACDVDPSDPDGNGEVSLDWNENGIPDECEDCNENGWPDFLEIDADPELDCNNNDILDVCEIDENSEAPGGPYYCTEDCDPDCNVNGIPDECDIADGASEDCDENGVPDECDPDCNENGIPDACDIADGTSEDANGNGIPDECEDCNENGQPDDLDIANETSEDCNDNGIPDECEIDENSEAPGGPFFCTEDCDPDCNVNGVPDWCDINDGASNDYNENGIPDECEPDCNENGWPDFWEIIWDPDLDCNENDIPDVCEIDENSEAPVGPFFCTEDCDPDCNVNGIPDWCDINVHQTSEDTNGNGVPDECETPGDVDGDGDVDTEDLLALLAAWGLCPQPPDPCPADFDDDGDVDTADLLALLANWG